MVLQGFGKLFSELGDLGGLVSVVSSNLGSVLLGDGDNTRFGGSGDLGGLGDWGVLGDELEFPGFESGLSSLVVGGIN